MKRLFLIFTFGVLTCINVFTKTLTIELINGSKLNYEFTELSSVDFNHDGSITIKTNNSLTFNYAHDQILKISFSNGNTTENDEGLKNFIGYWYDDVGHLDMLLLNDGICMFNERYYTTTKYEGKWVYDKDNKYLTNTATNQTILITLVDDNSLIGVNIQSNKTVSYHKVNYSKEIVTLLAAGKWEDSNGNTLNIGYGTSGEFSGSKVPSLPKNAGRTRYMNKWIRFNDIQTRDNDYQYKYTIIWQVDQWAPYPDNAWYPNNVDSQYSGTITIENPYTPSKTSLTFTGILEGTYTHQKE